VDGQPQAPVGLPPGKETHATDWTRGRVWLTTSRHVPQKDTKPCLCHTSIMSVHISLTRVSQNCGPFCLLCLDLKTEIYVTAEHARPRGSLECSWCGPYSADSLGLCNSDWLTLWGNLLTYEHYCIQCNTECNTAVGHDTSVHYHFLFLGASVILKKVTISLVMSACLPPHLSICMKQLGSHRRDFHEI